MRSTLSFTACGLNKWQLVLFSLLDLMQLPEKHQWQEKADEVRTLVTSEGRDTREHSGVLAMRSHECVSMKNSPSCSLEVVHIKMWALRLNRKVYKRMEKMDKQNLWQLETPFRLKPIKPSAPMEMLCVLSSSWGPYVATDQDVASMPEELDF